MMKHRTPRPRAALLALAAALALACAPAAARAAEASGAGGDARGDEVEAVVMWRLYNPYTGEHLYTESSAERAGLVRVGWRDEGYAWRAPESSSTTVWRLYNPYVTGGDHHYTTDEHEYAELQRLGWEGEGVGWYSDDGRAVAVGRLYNPNAATGTHHYTTDESERDELAGLGWRYEGVGWYALAGTPIMGETAVSASDMAAYYVATVGEDAYPADVYAQRGAATIERFCEILVEEAEAEGVRAEVVFAQAMKETGWLGFGGAVRAEQCNFAGLGAVNSNPTAANTFPDVRTGLRAQVQHLKAYASTDDLAQECVDVRFDLVTRGCAPVLEALNGRWAVPGDGYGESIATLIENLVAFSERQAP